MFHELDENMVLRLTAVVGGGLCLSGMCQEAGDLAKAHSSYRRLPGVGDELRELLRLGGLLPCAESSTIEESDDGNRSSGTFCSGVANRNPCRGGQKSLK